MAGRREEVDWASALELGPGERPVPAHDEVDLLSVRKGLSASGARDRAFSGIVGRRQPQSGASTVTLLALIEISVRTVLLVTSASMNWASGSAVMARQYVPFGRWLTSMYW